MSTSVGAENRPLLKLTCLFKYQLLIELTRLVASYFPFSHFQRAGKRDAVWETAAGFFIALRPR